jgi:hypothetical protein
MTFTINDVRACSGGNHVEVDITPAGRSMRTIHFLRSEILAEIDPDTAAEARERILHRMISRVKEATTGTPTPVQVRNALVGQTLEV